MSTASTLVLPPITLGTPNSDTAIVNTTMLADTRPYLAPGSVMVMNLRNSLVPIESAASYSRASDSASAAIRIIAACGNDANVIAITMPCMP